MEHNPAVALFLALGIIIVASRLAGAFARQLGQPRVLGELIVGVALGPTLINLLQLPILHGADLQGTVDELAEMGVLLLMFIVGLEVNVGELAKVGRVAMLAGVLGALLPVAIALPVTMLFGYAWQPALFAGVTLAATSVSISAQVLLELGVLQTKVGNALLATALVDDVIAILLVSLAVAVTGSSGEADAGVLAGIVARMAVYLIIAGLGAWFVLPRVMNWIAHKPSLEQSYGVTAFALIAMFLFAWSAEEMGGVAAITGAFLAGVGLSQTRQRVKHSIEEAVSFIAYGFLVPIFFVGVGLKIDLSSFPLSALPLALMLIVIAILTKVGGCGLGGKWGGFSNQDSFRLGVCMISRGEVGLIIASLGVTSGVLRPEQPLFSSLFLVILVSTLLTPLLVRRIFPHDSDKTVAKGAQVS
jgi:Kef-type K+ transport system membrane component KefB